MRSTGHTSFRSKRSTLLTVVRKTKKEDVISGNQEFGKIKSFCATTTCSSVLPLNRSRSSYSHSYDMM